MKLIYTMAARPIAWLSLLGILVLFLPAFTLSYWTISNTKIKQEIYMDQHQKRVHLAHDIQYITKFFPANETSVGLARILNATLRDKEPSLILLQSKVAVILIQALSTIPNLAEISFIGINGLFFSLSAAGEKVTALYTNDTYGSRNGSPSIYKWYTQLVSDAGELIGEARATTPPPATLKASMLLKAINSTNYASVGARWSGGSEPLFLNTVPISRSIGVISLGFPVKLFSDFFAARDLQGGGLYVATKDGVVVAVEGVISNSSVGVIDYDREGVVHIAELNDDQSFPFGGQWCKPVDKNIPYSDSSSLVEVRGKKYELYCSNISLAGVPSVYALAFPYYGLLTMIHKHSRRLLILLIMTIIAMATFVVSFMSLAVRSIREKMRLNSQLIKQMETTQQAEKKSNQKSMAIATASHDVRAALSAIIGLIDLCYHEVTPGSEFKESRSELKQSLRQMSTCANDLLGLLNSILDTSKIEAGKMQLRENEFNLAQLLEDLADLYHPVGMKKGVEVVLDPCDGSVYPFSNVRGDYGKLKQILANLLSNAVKFTKEGHISVRAWARKFSFDNPLLVDSNGRTTTTPCCSLMWLFKEQVKSADAESRQDLTKMTKMDPNCIEVVFEVDDTGIGIPKEKHKTVFENFEQVKDDVAAEVGEGTGLGLGIVRSLVQLMGGDIEIMDKSSYRGTCFRFNIFLVACDHQMTTFPSYCRSKRLPNIVIVGSSRRSMAPPPSPNNTDGSLIVLLIKNKGRRKMIHKFLENQGLRVRVAKEAKFLPSILKEVKSKLIGSSLYNSSDVSPRSCFSSSSSTHRDDIKNVPLTTLDGANETMRPNLLGITCVLLIIDANAGDFSDLSEVVYDFQKDLSRSTCCKVVWLEKPETRKIHFQRKNVAQVDEIFMKPLHGSRLFQVIAHLPEFGGQLAKTSPKRKRNNTMEVGSALDPGRSDQKLKPQISSVTNQTYQGETKEIGSTTTSLTAVKRLIDHRIERNVSSATSTSSQKPLLGKKVLIVEDNEVLKHVAAMIITRMGAALVETCRNGKEALDLVCESLQDQSLSGSMVPPYHFILMDCQMPVMDGFEATRWIRNEEAKYGLHTPIFALTAHDSGEIRDRMLEAGMDAHLERPLKEDRLLEAIRSLQWHNDS